MTGEMKKFPPLIEIPVTLFARLRTHTSSHFYGDKYERLFIRYWRRSLSRAGEYPDRSYKPRAKIGLESQYSGGVRRVSKSRVGMALGHGFT